LSRKNTDPLVKIAQSNSPKRR